MVSDFTFNIRHIHNCVSLLLCPKHLILSGAIVIALCSSPVAYWTPSNLGGLIFPCHIFLRFLLSMGFSMQNYCLESSFGVGGYFLLQRTMFCQNSVL